MAIEGVGKMQNILTNHAAEAWTNKFDAGFKMSESMEMPGVENKNFLEMLTQSVTQVNGLQQDANVAIEKLVTGETKNIHETMIAVEKAELAFKSMNQIRMKVIDAYKEIMRMQI